MWRYVAIFACMAVALAQDFDFDSPRPAPPRVNPSYSGPSSLAPRPTPVAIIKQIDKHNEDGSYTYGYESADGSFKIETKLQTGEVKGKYGYVDDLGKVRVIEYGATKHGFAPVGEGITVPPPTLVDETTDRSGQLLPEYSGAYDQQDNEPQQQQGNGYRPRPIELASGSFDYASAPVQRPAPRPAARPAPLEYSPPQTFEPVPRPAPAPRQPSAPSSSYTFDFPSSPDNRQAFTPASSPVPQRPAFSNAIPVSSPIQELGIPTRPAPSRPAAYAPAPITRPAQAPIYRPAPVAPRPAAPRPGSGSILDQLSKDYALPQSNTAPLHDISFGYF